METYTIVTDDLDELKLLIYGRDFYFAVCDLDQRLRGMIKYENKNHLQEARDLLYEILDSRGLDLEMVQ